jgi:ribosomal protein L11 methyltransferase
MAAGRVWRIALEVPAPAVPVFERALGEVAEAVSWVEAAGGLWRLEAISGREPEPGRLSAVIALAAAGARVPEPRFTVAPLEQEDWLAAAAKALAPVRVGRFFIHGSEFTGRAPPRTVPLELDAGLAFGTGRHDSTKGCLLALDWLYKGRRFAKPLDMGCGSGILALAMAKVGAAPVLAADSDADALEVAAANARANGVTGLVRAVASDGFKAAAVRRAGPFDLVAANIQAEALVRLAPDLVGHLAPGGVALLSGLLAREQAAVRTAYRARGLHMLRRVALGDWITLVMEQERPRAGPVRPRPLPD